ncbi:hypothetical protein MTR67_024264 [Solanum verrucosum]|uniref:60S ribosomal protein L27 n=1 Tax=Solanum verrucosum TaxID=315347 RepID=A0AAF0TSV1_SOLVR|nr:hypothetical protein MTR67_024264 [Solanum verrucosum]
MMAGKLRSCEHLMKKQGTRLYGRHCLAADVSKYPKHAKKSRVKAFIKLVNYNHIMPTHYTFSVDQKDVDVLYACEKKVTVVKKTKLVEGLKIGKN